MQGRKIPPLEGHSVEAALMEGDEADVLDALIVKYAHTIDNTNSARDIRALISGMIEVLDRRKQVTASGATNGKTPLSVVLGKAEEA